MREIAEFCWLRRNEVVMNTPSFDVQLKFIEEWIVKPNIFEVRIETEKEENKDDKPKYDEIF